MLRWLIRLGIAAILITGLGSQFYGIGMASSEQTLDQLRASIFTQLEERKTDISFDYVGDRQELSAQIGSLLREVFAEDDYAAYNVDAYLYTIRTWNGAAKINLSVTYRESAEEMAVVDGKIRELLPGILKDAVGEQQQARAIHDWIVTHVAYDTNLEHYTAYDALTSGTAVCQGYSLLAFRMLELAGFETRIVEGSVDSGSHVWNLVKVNGRWYHMDATWDDPVPDRAGQTSYAYFLKTDAQMKQDHRWTKPYPAAG
ncbi:hypothetical protein GZH47_08485 [Paenibacillus rhizovicinus]|uniref:Transglutaminase-like domain-containing protein n=1 Tax=Paenibacillus rhizovicinus TaxID=2704463 RepID=A0A6C0NY67_9BACL|nr:transglutaminase domain-containing protein [Paenibacillus rhizovicinus]QHW30886.1 hypothetical protein GZH47_08485 [Paenibacillus rhizovicinus]